MSFQVGKILKPVGFLLLGIVALGGLAIALGAVPVPWDARDGESEVLASPKKSLEGVELVKEKPHTLAVPPAVRATLGFRKGNVDIARVVAKPTRTQPLVMPGSTAFDPARLLRIRARFAPAQLVEIPQIDEVRKEGETIKYTRELRTGDRLKKGDSLGVFYSDVVGSKKNDLVDGILSKDLDQKILINARNAGNSLPMIFMWNAERNVRGDDNTINRALLQLKTWGVPDEDIVKLVGEPIMKAMKSLDTWNVSTKDIQALKDKAKDTKQWGRIEMKVPGDSRSSDAEWVLVERNVALNELVQDPTVNILQLARVDRLNVLANCPEDELPKLYQLRDELKGQSIPWTVQTVGSKPIEGVIDDIGYIIDPNQHTAVIKGHIVNPHELLRAGQFISATVELRPPPGVVEVPMDAVVEDGQQAIVFVQDPKNPDYYTMRRVEVSQRFEGSAFVGSTNIPKEKRLTAEEKEQGLLPREPLREGERVIVRGAVELKAALLDLESKNGLESKN